MSNPAVITLSDASSREGKFKRFVIEDNIGESIHLHIEDIRIDFTVNEFFQFSSMIRASLQGLDFLCGYRIDGFDEHFLLECSPFLPYLKTIEIEEVRLSDLKCIVHSNYKQDLHTLKLCSIEQTPVYKYLQGNKSDFLKYGQFNYFGMDNERRLCNLLASIEKSGYPYLNRHIVLFDGQNIVRDGQHRAAVLAHLYGIEATIKVMRFYFEGSVHLIKINKINIKSVGKWLVKKIYKKLKSHIRS